MLRSFIALVCLWLLSWSMCQAQKKVSNIFVLLGYL